MTTEVKHSAMFYFDLAVGLMRQHGLNGWTFEFDNAKRRAGVCRYRCKVISLSRHYVRLNADNYEDIRDTILHEIAHAIAGFKAAHGPAWKAVCRRIGAKPERCYDSSKVIMLRWMPTGVHPSQGCTQGFVAVLRQVWQGQGSTDLRQTCRVARVQTIIAISMRSKLWELIAQ